MGVSLSRMQNASFQSLSSSEATMQAQRYASTKMDYLVYNGYGRLSEQEKEVINDSNFKDEVILGNVSINADGISYRTVTINVYREDEAQPRAKLQQVFYSNDANRFVINGSSNKNSIELKYEVKNDKLYAKVDGVVKNLGADYCTEPASSTSTASADKPCVVVANYSDGTSWYRIWSDGWCEQGGKIATENAGSYLGKCTLMVPYRDTNYTILSVAEGPQYGKSGVCSHWFPITSRKTVDCFFVNGCDHFNSTYWEAKGYIR